MNKEPDDKNEASLNSPNKDIKNENHENASNENNNENLHNENETETKNLKDEDVPAIKEIPQDSELIEPIVKEAIDNKNNPNFIPKTAKQANFSLDKNDPRLKISMKDGSCQYYSFLYVIFRDPSLKRIFEPRVLKTDTDYYVLSKVEGENITFRIPCSTIAEEKSKNRGNLFPCDEEYVSALGVYLHALLFMKCGFIDRVAYQPFFSTDAFFDQKIRNVGFGFSMIFNNVKDNKNQDGPQEIQKEAQENIITNSENQENGDAENNNYNHENINNDQENKNETHENINDKIENQNIINDNLNNNNESQENLNKSTENKDETEINITNYSINDLPLHLNQKPEISLLSKTNRIDLFNDGSIFIKDTDELIEGHFFIYISIFPIKFKFGHCLAIFFNREEKKWKLYNSCPDEKYGEYGEMDLVQMKDFFFNGSCIIAGVPNEILN